MWAAITRWFSGSWITAIVGGIALTGISVIGVDLISSLKTAGAAPAQIAKAKIECDAARLASDKAALEQLADTNRRAAVAAQAERDKARADADTKAARIAVLQTLLVNQPATEQCGYSAEITRALRK